MSVFSIGFFGNTEQHRSFMGAGGLPSERDGEERWRSPGPWSELTRLLARAVEATYAGPLTAPMRLPLAPPKPHVLALPMLTRLLHATHGFSRSRNREVGPCLVAAEGHASSSVVVKSEHCTPPLRGFSRKRIKPSWGWAERWAVAQLCLQPWSCASLWVFVCFWDKRRLVWSSGPPYKRRGR
jgi:hypothetical protein